ncbi:MAG: nucleotide sugar dehydrogenase [Candidatus Tisiphia sp.]
MNNILDKEINSNYSYSLNKIKNKTAKVGVIGLGYVGLPLLCMASKAGYFVIGYDIDQLKINNLARGKSLLTTVSTQTILEIINQQKYVFSANEQILNQADIIIICVPTPVTKNYNPDILHIQNAVDAIRKVIKCGQLIILESTTYPGTTAEILSATFQKHGFTIGCNLFIAYSPEREDPGNKEYYTSSIPKVVGADDQNSLNLALTFYGNLVTEVVKVTSTKVAETVKLTENIFRLVNISLINELKLIYSKMGIDIWEIIAAAKTKPFGYMPFYPGPGIGGHCIPVDPFYLSWKAKEFNCESKFIEVSKKILNLMPKYVILRLQDELFQRMKILKNSRILILGVAYKENIGDYRESPALKIINHLLKEKAVVDYHDKYINAQALNKLYKNNNVRSIELLPVNFSIYDAVIICTKHDNNIDYKQILLTAQLVLDTRNAIPDNGEKLPNLAKA